MTPIQNKESPKGIDSDRLTGLSIIHRRPWCRTYIFKCLLFLSFPYRLSTQPHQAAPRPQHCSRSQSRLCSLHRLSVLVLRLWPPLSLRMISRLSRQTSSLRQHINAKYQWPCPLRPKNSYTMRLLINMTRWIVSKMLCLREREPNFAPKLSRQSENT